MNARSRDSQIPQASPVVRSGHRTFIRRFWDRMPDLGVVVWGTRITADHANTRLDDRGVGRGNLILCQIVVFVLHRHTLGLRSMTPGW